MICDKSADSLPHVDKFLGISSSTCSKGSHSHDHERVAHLIQDEISVEGKKDSFRESHIFQRTQSLNSPLSSEIDYEDFGDNQNPLTQQISRLMTDLLSVVKDFTTVKKRSYKLSSTV